MKQRKPVQRQTLSLVLMILGMAAIGSVLMFFSLKVKPESMYTAEEHAPTASSPSSAPAAHEQTSPPSARRPTDPKAAAAQNLSGLLLLFSLVAFAVAGAFLVWLIVSLRRGRPAWQTQQRYPRRR